MILIIDLLRYDMYKPFVKVYIAEKVLELSKRPDLVKTFSVNWLAGSRNEYLGQYNSNPRAFHILRKKLFSSTDCDSLSIFVSIMLVRMSLSSCHTFLREF